MQPKNIPHSAEHHQKVCLKSLLSYSGTKLAAIRLELLQVGNLKIYTVELDGILFREVTCQGSGWFSKWGLTLKIMRLLSLKLLTLWETGIKDHQDSMTCWKHIDQEKYVNAVFWHDWLWECDARNRMLPQIGYWIGNFQRINKIIYCILYIITKNIPNIKCF